MMRFWQCVEWLRRRFSRIGGRRIDFKPYRCAKGHVTPSCWLIHGYQTYRAYGRGEEADYDTDYTAHCPKCNVLVFQT